MIRATILGCGSSGGVPRLGGRWGACDPGNPKNRRRRCALLVERLGPSGLTQVLIDTGPDMVGQLLSADVATLDAVLYTHAHADHIHGIDDLRQLAFNARKRVPVWADAPTGRELSERFGYIFEAPLGSAYPPVAELHLIDGTVTIDGDGGPLVFLPFTVQHGDITALGFRVADIVYLPDVSAIPAAAWPLLEEAGTFICDALRIDPHISHAHLDQTVEWILQSRAARGVLTNMHIDMDYKQTMDVTPAHIIPAYDGLVIETRETETPPALVAAL